MGLVVIGLLLIGWRMLRGKSAAWLISANVTTLALVLIAADVSDLGAVAAWWNVSHAREVGGAGAPLDLCYLQKLGPAALLPMLTLERRQIGPALRRQAVFVRVAALDDLTRTQADWHGWTLRGAVRLAAARGQLLGAARGPAADPCMKEAEGAPQRGSEDASTSRQTAALTSGAKP
jgi:hypothetical protein